MKIVDIFFIVWFLILCFFATRVGIRIRKESKRKQKMQQYSEKMVEKKVKEN